LFSTEKQEHLGLGRHNSDSTMKERSILNYCFKFEGKQQRSVDCCVVVWLGCRSVDE